MKTLAKIGIVWAVLVPLLLFFEEIHVNNPMTFEIMYQNLYSISPKNPVSDDKVVNIPANGIMNWARMMREATTIEEIRTDSFLTVIVISSAVIIVLSIHTLRYRGQRDIVTTI